MVDFRLRSYHPSDLYMLYRICLLTGADGADASGSIDPEILGAFFAAPYAVLEPDLCFILTANGAPAGYILGTADSTRFATQAEHNWFPPLREKYPLRPPDDQSREAAMVRAIHRGYVAPPWSDDYPAHLHIDLLPIAQGRGQGGRLMAHFLDALKSQGTAGLHLGVSRGNKRALAWYPRFGFEVISENESTVVYGMLL